MRSYLMFIGDCESRSIAKTATGVLAWRPDWCKGQIRFTNTAVDLGLPDMTVADAVAQGIQTLVIGVAPVGGALPDSWLEVILDAVRAGMDVLNGLHTRLETHPQVIEAAASSGAKVTDVREPAPQPIANGRKRTGKRLLAVGTDCAVGKMFTTLALEKEMVARGLKATFRATGQTGIMIVGEGVPIDAVVSDFVAGAAEVLSPDADPDHWDLVEGQGSLFHPAYAGVSLGLLHGSQPDAIVICHEAGRDTIGYYPDYTVPSVPDCIDLNLRMGRLTNPGIKCAGVSVNTSALTEEDARAYLDKMSAETGLPCVDSYRFGVGPIVEKLVEEF